LSGSTIFLDSRRAIAQTSVRRAQHDASIADAERLRALEAAYQAALETTSDWELLTKYFGRDGLQALEIDAAGPELTENVNELLRACAGSRWTVSIELEKTLANGKGTSEGCEVLVTDNETGLRIDAKRLSGGQKVIVGEAMSLALSLLATKRVGSAGVTLVRDETGAALDPENTRGYVAMLRRAAQIAGAEKVLLVTHNEAVADMADSRLFIHDGNVDVL
jgi:exonuclease SbcC